MYKDPDLYDTHELYDPAGDVTEARKWLPFAYQKLKILFDRFKRDGMAISKWYQSPDGTASIRIMIKTGGYKYIYISAKTGQICPPYLSGAIKQSYITTGQNKQNILNLFYPSNLQNQYENYIRQQNNQRAQSPAWRQEPNLATFLDTSYYPIPASGNASEHVYLKSSMFTGAMRKLVQIMLADGADIQLDYTFNRTHGCIYTYEQITNPTTGKVTENDYFYFIEISANGLFYMPVDVCQRKPLYIYPQDSFPWIPMSSKFPQGDEFNTLLKAGVIQQALTQEEMQAFYQFQPFFAQCSWAFNSGDATALVPECSNTCYDETTGKSYLFTIQFAINPSSQNPVTATMTQLSSDYIQKSDNQTSGFIVPDSQYQEEKTFKMFDNSQPSYNAPIYVFYGGNNSKFVYSTKNMCYSTTAVGETIPVNYQNAYSQLFNMTADQFVCTNELNTYIPQLPAYNPVIDPSTGQYEPYPMNIVTMEGAVFVPIYDRACAIEVLAVMNINVSYDPNTNTVTNYTGGYQPQVTMTMIKGDTSTGDTNPITLPDLADYNLIDLDLPDGSSNFTVSNVTDGFGLPNLNSQTAMFYLNFNGSPEGNLGGYYPTDDMSNWSFVGKP